MRGRVQGVDPCNDPNGVAWLATVNSGFRKTMDGDWIGFQVGGRYKQIAATQAMTWQEELSTIVSTGAKKISG